MRKELELLKINEEHQKINSDLRKELKEVIRENEKLTTQVASLISINDKICIDNERLKEIKKDYDKNLSKMNSFLIIIGSIMLVSIAFNIGFITGNIIFDNTNIVQK